MPKVTSVNIGNLDFEFENTNVRVTANRNFPETKLAGLTVGPFEEGNEYEIYYWIAGELAKQGIVHFPKEDYLDPAKLFKTQWKERAQTSGQISALKDDFYPRLRRYVNELRAESTKTPEKMREYETVLHLSRDIVNSRMRKIVSLASSPTQTEQITKNLTCEEKLLHNHLSNLIRRWRKQILDYEEGKE